MYRILPALALCPVAAGLAERCEIGRVGTAGRCSSMWVDLGRDQICESLCGVEVRGETGLGHGEGGAGGGVGIYVAAATADPAERRRCLVGPRADAAEGIAQGQPHLVAEDLVGAL